MAVSFGPNDLVTRGILTDSAFFGWHVTRHEREAELSVVLASDAAEPRVSIVQLTGDRAFTLFSIDRLQARGEQFLALPGDARIELSTPLRTSGNVHEAWGSIIVSDAASYLVIKRLNNPWEDEVFLNLRDYTLEFDRPAIHTAFSQWKLTIGTGSEKQVLVDKSA